MLCNACQEIFAVPRKLSYGTYYDWKQDNVSFQSALRNGCHLCHLIEESLLSSSTSHRTPTFPSNVRFTFKALRSDWAQFGIGPKWFPIPSQAIGPLSSEELEHHERQFDNDPTSNNLSTHLESDSVTLREEMSKSWLVLEFYGPDTHFVLPIDLATGDETEDLAQENIVKQLSTGCEGSLALARKWLDNCLEGHSCCPDMPEHWLPTRLVDVGSPSNKLIRLVLGCALHGNPSYLALSHRWGSGEHAVLKSANLRSHQQGIPWAGLSPTLQDSIVVTRALGFRYLWVDTMCIIQDDPDDWSHEAGMMCKVYGLATCTIAGANSGEGDSGYFADRIPYSVRPCRVPNPFRMISKYSFFIRSQYLKNIHEKYVRGSTWYNRGWVFQERTLSSRLLIFSETQILWACKSLQAAEMWPEGKTSKNYIDTFPSLEIEKARFKRLLHPSNACTRNHMWFEFISDYIESAKLTFESDKLIAVQGLSTLVQNMTGESYCGGLWLSNDLPDAMMWTMESELPSPPEQWAAPSWSWAALNGIKVPNLQDSQDTEKLIKVIGSTVLKAPSKDRQFPLEALGVTGKLFPVTLSIPESKGRDDGVRVLQRVFVRATRRFLTKTARRNTVYLALCGLFVALMEFGIINIYFYAGQRAPGGIFVGSVSMCAGLLVLGYLSRRAYRERFPRKEPQATSQWTLPNTLPRISPRKPLIGRFESKTNCNNSTRFHCFMDYKTATAGNWRLFGLPLISREAKYTHGIILRSSIKESGYYERIGTFSISNSRLEWISTSHEDESFWLV